MAKLKDVVQSALDEARILLLGTEVLVGFGYRAFFEDGFVRLPPWARAATLASLALLVLAFCLLAAPAAYHRLVARGEDRPDVNRFTTAVLRVALLPMALGLGLDVAVAGLRGGGVTAGVAMGAAAAAAALAAWYLYTYGARPRRGHARAPGEEAGMEPTKVEEKIKHVLTEARMVLPGAQALLGFQFAVTLMGAFERLEPALRAVHLAALACIALSVVLLMTPAAYHRIVERGAATEHFHRVASRLVLAAMLPLALGLSADLLIVCHLVLRSYAAAGTAAAATLALFGALWFAWPFALRAWRRGAARGPRPPRRLRPAEAQQP